MNLFFAWLLAFAPLAAFSSYKPGRLEWGWFLVFGWLALSGERYVIWLVFLLAVFTGELASEWGKRTLDRAGASIPALDIGLGILLMTLPVFMLPGIRQMWWSQAPPALSVTETPEAAAQWLAEHPEMPGPLWSEIGFASYLIFAIPERPVWMYTLFELFPVEQWEQYKAVNNARYDWQAILDRDGINLMMVSVSSQPDLAAALAGAPSWCERYGDKIAVIYQRCVAKGE